MLFKATITDKQGQCIHTLATRDLTDLSVPFPDRRNLTWQRVVDWVTARPDVTVEYSWTDVEWKHDEMLNSRGKFSHLLTRLQSGSTWRLQRTITSEGVVSLTVGFDNVYGRAVVSSTLPSSIVLLSHVVLTTPEVVRLDVPTMIGAGVSERDVVAAANAVERLNPDLDMRPIFMPADRALAEAVHQTRRPACH